MNRGVWRIPPSRTGHPDSDRTSPDQGLAIQHIAAFRVAHADAVPANEMAAALSLVMSPGSLSRGRRHLAT